MGLRRDLEQIVVAKESKFGEFNGAVNENLDVWLVRDNELLAIAGVLSGEPFAGLFYNIDSEKYLLWNFAIDGFQEFVFETYGAIFKSEDFEGGVLPAGWSVVNGGENDWFVGTAAASTGTNGLYISNDGGTSNVYSSVGGGLDVSHVYFDIVLPAGVNKLFLAFDFRCEAEIGFDWGSVWSCPTSFTPSANTEIVDGVDGDQIGRSQYNNQSVFTREVIELDSGLIGATRRFIWSWRNDTSVENQPPMAIDNVQIIYQ